MFTATVDQIIADGTNLDQLGGVTLGDTLTGTLRFDPELASDDLDPSPDRSLFNLTMPSGVVLDYQVSGLSFPGGPFASFDIRNDIISTLSNNTDTIFIASGSSGFPANFLANQTFIDLLAGDASGQIFSQNEGFITTFDFNDYDLALANIYLNGNVNIDGQAFTNVMFGSTVHITAIPEPTSSLAFMFIGSFVAWRYRRGLRSHPS